MPKTVWKFNIEMLDTQDVWMPGLAHIVRASIQDEQLVIWAMLDPEEPVEKRTFVVRGTGHPIPHGVMYLDTVQQGEFVWHLFEDHEQL